MRAACRADRRMLQCKSPSVLGRTEIGACDTKAARGRAKKVGRGGTLNLKRGKENCHVNHHRQDPRPLEGLDFHPPHSSELFSESCHPSNQQKGNVEDAPALAVGESMIMTVRKFVHPFRRQICAKSRPQLREWILSLSLRALIIVLPARLGIGFGVFALGLGFQ